MKAKLASISLLLLLVAPAIVTISWLNYQKKMVKREVKWKMINGVDKSELVLLKFTEAEAKDQLRWKHSKEFEYQHEMYDIAERELHGDTTYYWCWWDHEETKLNKQLTSLLKDVFNSSPHQKEKQNQLFSFYKTLFFTKDSKPTTLENGVFQNEDSGYLNLYVGCFLKPALPPPEVV